VTHFRSILLRNRWLAALLVAFVLLARLVVPAGYMPAASSHGFALVLCSGVSGQPPDRPMPGMPGMASHEGKADGGASHHAMPCAFSSAIAPLAGGADPFLLIVAMLFGLVAAVLAPVRIVPARRPHERPPLRGPPQVLS